MDNLLYLLDLLKIQHKADKILILFNIGILTVILLNLMKVSGLIKISLLSDYCLNCQNVLSLKNNLELTPA